MHAGPIADRYESLDVLRGVAILGIFAVNIVAFGYTFQVLGNPSIVSAFEEPGGSFWWSISSGFFTHKFITIFSGLFGAGIVLMLGEEKSSPKTPIHRRRMFWLFMIGMVHAHLLWYGDILVPYAVTGFLIARARVWRSRTLVIVGTLLVIFNFGLFYLQDFSLGMMSPEEFKEMSEQMWSPPPDVLQAEIEKFRLGFFERIPHTIGNSLIFQGVQTIGFGFRTAGVMMFGIALYKTGFLTLRWRLSTYAILGVVCTALGLAGSLWGTHHHLMTEFNMLEVFPGQAALYWGSLFQSFGYAALVMLVCSFGGLIQLLRIPFAAAGRMALSNYLASTIIGILIFYGPPGLGKIGTMDYSQLAAVVGGVWLFILVWSSMWMALFRFGPAEWIWRSLTYGRLQPVLKNSD